MASTPQKPGKDSLSNHPLNLALAFALELVLLGALAYWGWSQHDGILRVLLAVGLPVIAAVLWGVFRVDNDPNKAIVVIPGILRLLLEWGLFALGVALLWATGEWLTATIFGLLVILHYALSLDYLRWKIAQR